MNNSVWNRAVSDALAEAYSDSTVCTMPQTPHVFSQRHESRMADFFAGLPEDTCTRQARSPKARLHRILSIAAIIAILGIGCTMAVSSDDSPFSHFRITYSDILSAFEPLSPAPEGACPETIEDIYVITCDLPGFEITDQNNTGNLNYVYYADGGTHAIFFEQYTAESIFSLNTEDSEPTEIEFGDGQKAIYFYTNQKYDNLVWNNDGYTFVLTANVGKESLIRIAESIEKAD